MKTIIKIWRETAPGMGMVWCLKWSDGTEEYTGDTAAGRSMFPRWQELKFRSADICHELGQELDAWHEWRQGCRKHKPKARQGKTDGQRRNGYERPEDVADIEQGQAFDGVKQ